MTTETAPSPAVYSRRKGATPAPPDAVYVGRRNSYDPLCIPNPWSNPFFMWNEHDRDEVCDAFEVYAARRLKIELEWLEPLRGKSLVCWCQSPTDKVKLRCHAECLLRLANAPKEGVEDE